MNGSIKKYASRLARQALWILPLAGLFIFISTSHSFMVIASSSMKPTLKVGDMVLIHSTPPEQLKVGDIIDYKVPSTFQKLYGYPASICHRIISIQQTTDGLAFRTKGDATNQDPFLVVPENLVGKETSAIPYVGYPIAFIESRSGIIMVGGLILLILFYRKGDNITLGAQKFRGVVFGVSATEFNLFQREQQEQMREMNQHVTVSMDKFSTAMAEYAKHLESHTTAVKSLAQAAVHLDAVVSSGTRPLPWQGSNAGVSVASRTDTDVLLRQLDRELDNGQNINEAIEYPPSVKPVRFSKNKPSVSPAFPYKKWQETNLKESETKTDTDALLQQLEREFDSRNTISEETEEQRISEPAVRVTRKKSSTSPVFTHRTRRTGARSRRTAR